MARARFERHHPRSLPCEAARFSGTGHDRCTRDDCACACHWLPPRCVPDPPRIAGVDRRIWRSPKAPSPVRLPPDQQTQYPQQKVRAR